jgi:hypothetical protein
MVSKGTVSGICLVGTVYGGSPARGTADHRRRQNATDIALGDQVLGVIDRRRHLALQPDGVADPFALCCSEHSRGFIGVAAQRPFAIDVLPGLDRGYDRRVVVGHLHADRDQIDVGMLSQFRGIAKRQRHPVMLRCCVGRNLPGCANGGDLEVRKRLQSWDVSIEANPRLGLTPTMPTRILLLMAISFLS